MGTETKIEWMQAICNDSPTGHPVSLTVNGEPWAFATNGYFFVAVKADSGIPGLERDDARFIDIVERGLSAAYIVKSRMASLRQFAREGSPDDCPSCKGKGEFTCFWCDGTGKAMGECEDCGHEHKCTCHRCDGEGKQSCEACGGPRKYRTGTVGGLVVNRTYLHLAVPHLGGDEVLIAQTILPSPLFVKGDDWLIGIMPITGFVDEEKATLPSLEVELAQ